MDLSGRTINQKYTLIKRIATSNMAAIYQAEQAKTDGYVAVKVLHEHLTSNPVFKKRFELEAKVLMQLQHPHIVNLIDFDTTKIDNTEFIFLVMDFIEGGTLGAHIRQKQRLPMTEALNIMDQLLAALIYTHHESIAHRDIKPENILFKADNNVVLTDFGLARLVASAGLTSTSAISMGTIQYIAPEVLQAKANYDYMLVDVYGLGMVFYEMVTGKTPYQGGENSVIYQKLTNQPFPPAHEVNPEVPLAVSKVISRALAFNPKDRYQTMRQFAEAVQQLPHAISQPPPAPRSPLQNWLRFIAASLVVSGIALVTAFVIIEELFIETTPDELEQLPVGMATFLDNYGWFIIGAGMGIVILLFIAMGLLLWRQQRAQKSPSTTKPSPQRKPPPKANEKPSQVDKTKLQSPSSPPKGSLVVQESVGKLSSGQQFPLLEAINTLGRIADNQIMLDDNSVSRHHARIVLEGTTFRIEDLQSANGVKVNGAKVESQLLKENDRVEIGRIKFIFVISLNEEVKR